MYAAGAAGRYYGDEGVRTFVVRDFIGRGQIDGKSHVLDRVRQFSRRRLTRPVLDVAGHLLQDHPDTDDVRPLADHPLDVPHATLAGHALDTDFNRAGLVRGMPRFQLARHAHQMRRALVVGVVIAIPSKIFTDKFKRIYKFTNLNEFRHLFDFFRYFNKNRKFNLDITFMTRCVS